MIPHFWQVVAKRCGIQMFEYTIIKRRHLYKGAAFFEALFPGTPSTTIHTIYPEVQMHGIL